MNTRNRLVLGVCFFLSGATSLALEVAWAKELSYILGNTLYAVATVVAAFMAGLGLGSALAGRYAPRILRPVLAYAGMEWVIAACGIFSIPVFRSTEGIFQALYNVLEPGHGAFLVVRFLVVFGVMLIPVTLMGMTLPVVVGAYGRRKERYDFEAGTLYGVNTLGAVAGTLVAGFFLLPWLGLLKTCVLVGVVDAVVGVVAWCVNRRVGAIEDIRLAGQVRTQEPEQAESVEERKKAGWTPLQVMIGGIFLLSGAVAMVYEVGWFRLLALVLGPSVHAFSVMLGIFLVGIGLGSVVAARWAERTRRPLMAMAALEGVIGVAALATMAFYNELPIWYTSLFWKLAGEGGGGWHVAAQGMIAAVVVLVPTLGMGALFPVAVRAFREASREGMVPEKSVGRLYVLNTGGGIAGSLAAGFWLVPEIGMWRTVLLASGVSVGLGLILWLAVREVALLPKAALAATTALVVAVFAGAVPAENTLLLNQGWYYKKQTTPETALSNAQAQQLLFYREGVNAAISVTRHEGYISLRTQGKPDASNGPPDLFSQFLGGHLPALFAPEGARAAFVGYGSGMAVSALMAHPHIASLDIVEIERAVLDASPYFEFINHGALRDPRVRTIVEDARTHLTYTPSEYDVIVSIPSNPSVAGVSNLYTVDFYRLVRERLTPSGIFLSWLQLYNISDQSFLTVVASLLEVFPHVAVFQPSSHIMFLASQQPIQVPWETYLARSSAPAVERGLRLLDFREPMEVLAHFVGTESVLEASLKGVSQRNTDDNVWLEHQMARELPAHTHGNLLMARLYPPRTQIRRLLPDAPLGTVMPKALRNSARREATKEPAQWTRVWKALMAQWETETAEPAALAAEESSRKDTRAAAAYMERVPDQLVLEDTYRYEPYIKQAFELAPELPEVRLVYGNFLFLREDLDGAKQVLEKIPPHSIYSHYYYAQLTLARIAQKEGDLGKALEHIEKAVSINPCKPSGVYAMADVLEQHPDPQAAERLRRVAALYHPEDDDLRRKMAALPEPD
ncbi:MAG: fused MFS/spermidine synthase [Acidobacteriota bacterium]|nr:MAG: fused MFS/spermidine synthase [Acidobacteriota bacterium]